MLNFVDRFEVLIEYLVSQGIEQISLSNNHHILNYDICYLGHNNLVFLVVRIVYGAQLYISNYQN